MLGEWNASFPHSVLRSTQDDTIEVVIVGELGSEDMSQVEIVLVEASDTLADALRRH